MNSTTIKTLFSLAALFAPLACGGDPTSTAADSSELTASDEASHHHGQARILDPSERVQGHSLTEWSEQFQRWVYSVPADQNPLLHPEVACGIDQSGPVFFIPPGGRTQCDVPAHKFVFVTVNGALFDFPCPDPTFHPAPGQTLEAFLRDGVLEFNQPTADALQTVDLIFDGQAPIAAAARRVTSPLFYFRGDLSLSTPDFDSCVTGHPQPGVFDGWQVMLSPLSPGDHTFVTRDRVSGASKTLTLHVRDDDGCGDD